MAIKNNQLESQARVLGATPSPPVTGAGFGVFYPKEVSGIAEGFYKDSDGNEIQLTSNGSILIPVSGEANTASNVGTGSGEIFKQKTGVDLELRKIKAGSNITVAIIGDDIEISAPAPSGETNTSSNVGTGNQVFKQKTGVDFEFRTLKAGSNVTIVSSLDEITISAAGGGGGSLQVQDEGSLVDNAVTTLNFIGAGVTATQTSPGVVQVAVSGGGSGETNTASNLGAGDGVFAQKSGVDLQFKSLVAGTNITLTPSANSITIDAAAAGGETNTASNVGTAGVGIFKQKSGLDLQFKKINSGDGISITDDVGNDEVDVALDVNGLTAEAVLDGASDYVVVYDTSAGAHRKALLNNLPGGGGGESNTASNQGSGAGIFKQKTGIDLEFKSVIGGEGLTQTGNTNDITLDLDINALTADATPDGAADFVVTYDASAGSHKKVALNDLPGGGGGSVLTELVIQLGAGATIANKVSAAPTGGIPGGITIVNGTDGSVDSELAGAVDDMVIIHNLGRVAVSVEAIGEGPVFTPTFDQKFPSSSGAGFPPGTMKTASSGNQTRLTGWNTAVGSNNERTWTIIRLAPILT